MKRAIVTMGLGVLVAACGASADAVVRNRAAFDLRCEEGAITVAEVGGICSYTARGCGLEAAYVVRSQSMSSVDCCPVGQCQVVLNSDVRRIGSQSAEDEGIKGGIVSKDAVDAGPPKTVGSGQPPDVR